MAAGHSRGSELLKEWRNETPQVEACALLGIGPVSYNRFERGVRKPPAAIGVRIERLTLGKVPATSWYEPPLRTAKAA